MLGKSRRNKLSNHFYAKANVGTTPPNEVTWKKYQLILQHRKVARAAIKIMGLDFSRDQQRILDIITTGGGSLTYVAKNLVKPLFKGWKSILKGHEYAIKNQEEFLQVVKEGTAKREIIATYRKEWDDVTPPFITTVEITYIKNKHGSGYARIIIKYDNENRIKSNTAIIKWIGQYLYKHIPEGQVVGASRWNMPEVIVNIGKGTLKYKFSDQFVK